MNRRNPLPLSATEPESAFSPSIYHVGEAVFDSVKNVTIAGAQTRKVEALQRLTEAQANLMKTRLRAETELLHLETERNEALERRDVRELVRRLPLEQARALIAESIKTDQLLLEWEMVNQQRQVVRNAGNAAAQRPGGVLGSMGRSIPAGGVEVVHDQDELDGIGDLAFARICRLNPDQQEAALLELPGELAAHFSDAEINQILSRVRMMLQKVA